MPIFNRALIYVAAVGIIISAMATVATFTSNAAGYTFLRYPLAGAAIALIAVASWGSGRDLYFRRVNRILWSHAPWWARLAWLTTLIAALTVFATIPLSSSLTMTPAVQTARGLGASAAYLFLFAGLVANANQRRSRHPGQDYKVPS